MIDFKQPGRTLSTSKAMYRRTHPDHNIVFGAVLASKQAGQIWHGDIDLDEPSDAESLKSLARRLNQEIYVFRAMDARSRRTDEISWDRFVVVVRPRGDIIPNVSENYCQ
jgi:hypothetical protein